MRGGEEEGDHGTTTVAAEDIASVSFFFCLSLLYIATNFLTIKQ